MKKFLCFIIAAVFVFLNTLTSCTGLFSSDSPGEGTKERIASMEFTKVALTLGTGSSDYVRLSAQPASAQKDANLTWEYDAEFIEVNPDNFGAIITGKKEGKTYLKAKADGVSSVCIITVEGSGAQYEAEYYIYSNFTVAELTPGSTQTVSVSLYGGLAYDLESFTWSVADNTVASITPSRNNCLIQALKKGSTQLKAEHPKTPYSYTITIYVYTDEQDAVYLTTANNVVLLNMRETPSYIISAGVQNSREAVNQADFTWEVIPEQNKPACVSITPNGTNALITPLQKGSCTIRVTYARAEYPLSILVLVRTAVTTAYITTGTPVLEVTGSVSSYAVSASVEGITGYADPSKFTWTIPDEAHTYMDWFASENTLSVTGKSDGAVKVKVAHELAEYSRCILIIMKEQAQSAIDASVYITSTDNYIQTKVGEGVRHMAVSLAGGEAGDEQRFTWAIDNGIHNDVCLVETTTGGIASRTTGSYAYGNLHITPRNPGTTVVTVSHPKTQYPLDIVIKVYPQSALLEEPAILESTSSIVRILNGSSQEISASITGNTSAGDENGISWRADNPSRVSLNPALGKSAALSALGTGTSQSYITASHPKAINEKRILVVSADTQEQLDAAKGFYADTTYFRINVQGNSNLSVTQFGLSASEINAISWVTDAPSVCTVQRNSQNPLNAVITGISEGTALVSAALAGTPECKFYITVLPEGMSVGVITAQYLTTQKNAVVLSGPDECAQVSVTGINIAASDMALYTAWQADNPSVIHIASNGQTAAVTALSYGKSKITVSNPKSSNSVTIDVKVGALYEWDGTQTVYITTGDDVIILTPGEETVIAAALVNSSAAPVFNYSAGQTGSGGEIIYVFPNPDGSATVGAIQPGTAAVVITDSVSGASKEVAVVVTGDQEDAASFKYLTTRQNVVTAGLASSITVSVTVANASAPVLSGYHWASSDSSIISAVSSGQAAVLNGLKAGTVKITVTNDEVQYPLEIIANCVDMRSASSNPYITGPRIVTLNAGQGAAQITADLVGGTPADYRDFAWNIANSSIVSLYASNETAQIQGLREGVTQILVSHPKAGNVTHSILVIVEPEKKQECYINVSETIIRMSPQDSAHVVTAALINGNAADVYNFRWWADSYDTIDLNYTADQAVITPLKCGTAYIHAAHPKSPYQRDIVVIISQYAEFAFETTSIAIEKGKQIFVNMQTPVLSMATQVSYQSNNSTTASAGGTASVCIIEARKAGTAIITAKLVAKNSGVVQASCELLVAVEETGAQPTYINYPGSTILTIEKGVAQTLSASLSGPNAAASDADSLQWKASDSSVIKLTPSPSASGVTVAKEIQVTALKAGAEATVTISHAKTNSAVTVYCIIPGTEAAAVKLDKTLIGFTQGDNPVSLAAAITNAKDGDYANLSWSVSQTQQVVQISGSGKSISVIPKAEGNAVITAKVPSSNLTAKCEITVEEAKAISVDLPSFAMYPSLAKNIAYTVTPASDVSKVIWTSSDSSILSFSDNKAGRLTVTAKYKEGNVTITGKTPGNASVQINIRNEWGNTFYLNKSYIKTIPVNNNDGTFEVEYEVRPAVADVYVSNLGSLTLKPGTYTSVTGGVYKIASNKHVSSDTATGAAKGTISFVPNGEVVTNVLLEAYNPVAVQAGNGAVSGMSIKTTILKMQVFYPSYTFTPAIISSGSQGTYSRYDVTNGYFVLGDGETRVFSLSYQGNPVIQEVVFEEASPSSQENAQNVGYQKDFIAISKTGSNWRISHSRDYGAKSGVFYGKQNGYTNAEKEVEKNNATVKAFVFAGMISIKYVSVDSTGVKSYSIPLYAEIRDCAAQ